MVDQLLEEHNKILKEIIYKSDESFKSFKEALKME